MAAAWTKKKIHIIFSVLRIVFSATDYYLSVALKIIILWGTI